MNIKISTSEERDNKDLGKQVDEENDNSDEHVESENIDLVEQD